VPVVGECAALVSLAIETLEALGSVVDTASDMIDRFTWRHRSSMKRFSELAKLHAIQRRAIANSKDRPNDPHAQLRMRMIVLIGLLPLRGVGYGLARTQAPQHARSSGPTTERITFDKPWSNGMMHFYYSAEPVKNLVRAINRGDATHFAVRHVNVGKLDTAMKLKLAVASLFLLALTPPARSADREGKAGTSPGPWTVVPAQDCDNGVGPLRELSISRDGTFVAALRHEACLWRAKDGHRMRQLDFAQPVVSAANLLFLGDKIFDPAKLAVVGTTKLPRYGSEETNLFAVVGPSSVAINSDRKVLQPQPTGMSA
jgi:hypothetical protein